MQHGFIQGRSCITQLLCVPHDLGALLDAGEELDVVYLDFSKAFDSVLHRRLLHKLSLFNTGYALHSQFKDYLTSRSQCVHVDGVLSSWSQVISSVPQGSLLGTFLFLLYINDVLEVVAVNLPAPFLLEITREHLASSGYLTAKLCNLIWTVFMIGLSSEAYPLMLENMKF